MGNAKALQYCSCDEVQDQDLSIEQEIERPRYHDVKTLYSEFDRFGYCCEECSFSLHSDRTRH
jgi:hypothetical protein